ncbi:hypothetical protein NX059_010471 [Plenodomus lindquistii]|nr:hypothetical protein NX059_010471 [Plenodomus lindquistii]
MSLKTVHTVQAPWFYPTGNTSPVCYMQNLPPDEDAALLLLGCGDMRSLLFTTYCEEATNTRKLDFTCCDLEAEIVARNILALSIIVDDTKGERVHQLWNIYYHVFLDQESARVLRSQAQKLSSFADSLQSWASSPYAKLIRFGDSTTLKATAKLWASFTIEPATGELYKSAQAELKKSWTNAKKMKKDIMGENYCMVDSTRSAAPLLSAGVQDSTNHYRIFWQTGTTFEDRQAIQKATIANPMFGTHRRPLTLHYGAHPLAGYHLAPAYARLLSDSPLTSAATGLTVNKKASRALQAATIQLSQWCAAFRAVSSRVTIRYVASDAIAFCHVLQYHQKNTESMSAHWYRSIWTYEPLVLDSVDYGEGGDAPTAFHVIDSSNLMDHLGCLNLLVATSGLLLRTTSSSLRTEMLIPREGNTADSVGSMLCGDLPSVALLLGLTPVQYWSDATATWHAPRAMSTELFGDNWHAVMSRPILIWKPVDLSGTQYEAAQLAKLFLSIYLDMFQDESWAKRFSMLGISNKQEFEQKLTAYEVYTRASFVVLLQHIKGARITNWERFMRLLIHDGILNDQTLNMGPHHLQSLFVHLDMLSVWQPDMDWWHPRSFAQDLKGRFKGWKDIPPTVCVTLVVPYSNVAMFADISEGNGTPLCQLQLHSSLSPKEAFFPDVQLGFGQAKPTGKAYTNQYALTMHEDAKGWNGSSALIVSAMVSTCSLVEYGDQECNVVFALKNTPVALAQFRSKLGFSLHLHRSAVGNKDVFVTRYRPNMRGHVVTGAAATFSPNAKCSPPQGALIPSPLENNNISIFPALDARTGRVTALRILFHIESEEGKASLQQGGEVAWEIESPRELVLTIGKKFKQVLALPLPLHTASSKTKIARKSSWIEYTAPVASVKDLSLRADSVFRSFVNQESQPVLESLHYVHVDALPKLQLNAPLSEIAWLTAVVSPKVTMSTAEFKQYQMMLAMDAVMLPGRLGIKESLQSMYAHIFSLEGVARGQVFQLGTSATSFGVLYVDAVRMDVSNQTTLLDAAFFPHQGGPEILTVDNILQGRGKTYIGIKVQKDEASFWKHLLPAFAERCRQWKHKDICEYRISGRMPLSIDDNKPFMCTCGMGIFPDNYLGNHNSAKQLLKHGTRVAVPVVSASPISKDDPDSVSFASLFKDQEKRKNENQSTVRTLRVEDITAKKGTCFECGAKEAEGGEALLKCSKCKVAQYCSAECQKKEWKTHKLVCKQLKEN